MLINAATNGRARGAAWLALAALACILAGPAQAQVTSRELTVTPMPGFPTLVPLTIDYNDAQPVAAISGQINYSPEVFGNPRIYAGPGAPFFNAIGHEPAPGEYRFVLFASPTRNLANGSDALTIILDPSADLPKSGTDTISYSVTTASTPQGQSIDDIQFNDVLVTFMRNSTDENWLLYQ